MPHRVDAKILVKTSVSIGAGDEQRDTRVLDAQARPQRNRAEGEAGEDPRAAAAHGHRLAGQRDRALGKAVAHTTNSASRITPTGSMGR